MLLETLNDFALELDMHGAAFQVLYWGGIPDHSRHPLHRHSFIECCHVTEGTGTYTEGGKTYSLEKGCSFISRPGIWHKIESETGIGLIWVAFELMPAASSASMRQRYEELLHTERVCLQPDPGDDKHLLTASLWRELAALERSTGPFARQILNSLAHALILSFFQLFPADKTGPNGGMQMSSRKAMKRYPADKESLLMQQAKLFIMDNLSLRIKFRDLAKYLHVSERHLSRIFNKECGKSFTAYYRQTKIETAAALLQQTDETIKRIAEACGFYSVHHFSKVFKQETGMTPGECRKTGNVAIL